MTYRVAKDTEKAPAGMGGAASSKKIESVLHVGGVIAAEGMNSTSMDARRMEGEGEKPRKKVNFEKELESESESDTDELVAYLSNPRPGPLPQPRPLLCSELNQRLYGDFYDAMRSLCSQHQDATQEDREKCARYVVNMDFNRRAETLSMHALIPAPLWAKLKPLAITGIYVMTYGISDEHNWKTKSVKFYFADETPAMRAVSAMNTFLTLCENAPTLGYTVKYPDGTHVRDPENPHSKRWKIQTKAPFYERGRIDPIHLLLCLFARNRLLNL